MNFVVSDRVVLYPKTAELEKFTYTVATDDVALCMDYPEEMRDIPLANMVPFPEDLKQNNEPDLLIRVNTQFYLAPIRIQEVILYHEVGHAHHYCKLFRVGSLMDKAKAFYKMKELYGGVLSDLAIEGEKQADLFAARHLGAEPVLELLEMFYDRISKSHRHNKEDLKMDIKRIENIRDFKAEMNNK